MDFCSTNQIYLKECEAAGARDRSMWGGWVGGGGGGDWSLIRMPFGLSIYIKSKIYRERVWLNHNHRGNNKIKKKCCCFFIYPMPFLKKLI